MPTVIIAIGAAIVGAIGTVGVYTATTLFVIGASASALVIGAGILALKALMPSVSYSQPDNDKTRQSTVKSTVEPQKIIYGEALVSGPVTFVGVSGADNQIMHHVIALAGHEVDSITDIWLDDQAILNSQFGVAGVVTSGTFQNIMYVQKFVGSPDQTADAILVATWPDYTTNHRGREIAYIHTQFILTDESQEVWDKYSPSNIKAIVRGRKIYDPRLDVTPGANPTNSSYIAYSDNPALAVADYLINTRFGMKVDASKIDWLTVSNSANACDAVVDVPSGTEKRFTANGVLFATDSHRASINKLLSAMNGKLIYSSGIYYIKAGFYEAPTESMDEEDLSGAVSIKTSVERSERFNTVGGVFIDPAQLHKTGEFPKVTITSALLRDNNEVLEKEIELPFTNSMYMAQRIANKLIQLSDQQKMVTFPANLAGLRVAVGDRVSVSIEELNWSSKVFECLGWSFNDGGEDGVMLTLIEDDAGSYADMLVGEYSTVSPDGVITDGFPGVPDPQNLSATAGLKSVDLNWVNPVNTAKFKEIAVYASPDSSWANKVEIGRTMGTQFFHDASNAADPLAVGDTRFYWVRALAYGTGTGSTAESDRNPDNDISNISATVGPITPDYTDVIDDTPDQVAPTLLTLVETTVLGNDGSVLPAVEVSWTLPTDSQYISFFEVEFKKTNEGEIDYGLVAATYTAVLNYELVGDATTWEINYGAVNQPVVGVGREYSSVNVYGTTTVIAGMEERQEFTFRVRAVTLTGKVSEQITGTINLQGDLTAPAIATSIVATGGIHQIKLDWVMPTDTDLAFIEIFESTTSNQGASTLVVQTLADQHTITSLPNNATRYYWLRSVDRSGNISGFSSMVSATTQLIGLDDLNQGVIDEFAAGDAFGIQPVSTLSGVTGEHVGQVKLLTTTNTLYVWDGTAWTTELFTASNVDPGAITAASFASGIEPISSVTSLPSPTGYTGPNIIFLTTDKKLYRYDSSVPEFTTLVNTADIDGTLGENLFSDTLRPIERVSSLPNTGLVTGRVVMLTTDSKLYRYTGSSWTSAIAAADLTDQLNLATQASGLLPVANAAAGLVNGNVTINADGTLSGGGAGQATLGGLGAGQVATLDVITETFIGDNAISTAKIQANAITANEILAGQIIAAKLAVGSVTANAIAANSISTAALQAGAVTANSLAVGAVVADKISANAVTVTKLAANSVNASKIIAASITADRLNVSQVFADNAVIGAIQSSSITTSAVVSAIGTFQFISSSNIVAGTILASNLNINEIFANTIILGKTAAAAPVQSVAGATGAVSASTIITAGNLVVQGEITDFITGGQVNANVTSISGGTITTGTVNANRINIDGITLSRVGDSLVINTGGVNTTQVAANAITSGSTSFTEAATGTTLLQQITITTSTASSGVEIFAQGYIGIVGSGGGGAFVYLNLYRDATLLKTVTIRAQTDRSVYDTSTIIYLDTPNVAGTYTYKLTRTGYASNVSDRYISVREFKR
tara:strand:+ start:9102 stop:13580 length:4479 start_codon:yes stop_codon:yes gene_type:complete